MEKKRRRLRQKAQHLLNVSLNSFNKAIDTFNSSDEQNRFEFSAILIIHAFETLLKAYLFQHDGRITPKRKRNAYSLNKCMRKIPLKEPHQRIIQGIETYRNLAQHNILSISENIFYLMFSNSVSVYRALIEQFFDRKFFEKTITKRNLFVSPATENLRIFALASAELKEIRAIMESQRNALLTDRLKTILLLEDFVSEKWDPKLTEDSAYLEKKARRIYRTAKKGKELKRIFPEISSIVEPVREFRFSVVRTGGIPVTITKNGPGTAVAFQKLPKKSKGIIRQFLDFTRAYAGRREERKPPTYVDVTFCIDLLEHKDDVLRIGLNEIGQEYLFFIMAKNYLPLGIWFQEIPKNSFHAFIKHYADSVKEWIFKSLVRQLLFAELAYPQFMVQLQ